MADAHLSEGYLKVMGKGAKERIVPIGNVAQRILQRYVFHFRPESLDGDGCLFLTLGDRPMSANAVKLIFTRLAQRSGVSRLHPHLCRHTFATNYLVNDGDVFSLQQILEHTTLEMVRRYVTLASAQVRVQHCRFSPMDRMSLGVYPSNDADRRIPLFWHPTKRIPIITLRSMASHRRSCCGFRVTQTDS